MKKCTMFPNLIQKIVSEDEINEITELVGYKDTGRKFDVWTLIRYFVTAAANKWESYRHSAEVGSGAGLPRINYSTFSKKASEVPYELMKKVFECIVQKCNRATRRSLKISKKLLLIDSTTITVGKTRLPWAIYHGERSGVKLHVAYTDETEMPLKVMETIGTKHDGPIGKKLADKRFILVEDRAYMNLKRFDSFVHDRQSFVIRLKSNVEIVRPKSLQRIKDEESNVIRDITCKLGTEQCRTEKRHRVVFFLDHAGNEIRVVTDLRHVSAEAIADMYKARWQIENFFRWIKQYLNVPILFGTTKNAVYHQLFAALIAYVLLKWLYQKTSQAQVKTNLSFISFVRCLLNDDLSIDWLSEMILILKQTITFYGISLPKSG